MSKYVSKIFVTVDVLVINKKTGEILLIKRLKEPFKDCWALPGGFVDEGEDLEQAARRELLEETNVETGKMTQVGAFGKPNRDPRGHMISVAYQTNLIENQIVKAKDDAKEVKWFSINDLPDLAFDHLEIINSIL
jgi:8-oxo-dGTP diphosphatase